MSIFCKACDFSPFFLISEVSCLFVPLYHWNNIKYSMNRSTTSLKKVKDEIKLFNMKNISWMTSLFVERGEKNDWG